VAVDHVKIIGPQTLATPLYALSNPCGRIVEEVCGYPTNLGQDKIVVARIMSANQVGVKGCPKYLFGRAIVGRCVKGMHSLGKRLLDECCRA
jgi:hypothetical protein